MKHGSLPPPCLAQRPLRAEGVVQSATEHGFFLLPPCLSQCDSLVDLKPVVQPANWHFPNAPCFLQRLRACARVLQPISLHAFVLPPPCLPHLPLRTAAVVHRSQEQTGLALCLLQTPRHCAPALHPSAEQNPFAPCFVHSPFPTALLLQPSVEHFTLAE